MAYYCYFLYMNITIIIIIIIVIYYLIFLYTSLYILLHGIYYFSAREVFSVLRRKLNAWDIF